VFIAVDATRFPVLLVMQDGSVAIGQAAVIAGAHSAFSAADAALLAFEAMGSPGVS
jgi:hypothetical protein